MGQLWQPDRRDRPVQPADQLCLRFDGTARRRCKTRWACGRRSSTTARAGWLPTSIRWAFGPVYAYDANSQLLRVQDPLGHITTTLHDNVNRLTAQIDPLGNRTSFTYDVDGRLIRTTNPIGAITTQVFDANSRLVATVDPLGLRTSYGYDAFEQFDPDDQSPGSDQHQRLRPGQPRWWRKLTRWGTAPALRMTRAWNLIRTINPLGFITTSVFDSVNRLVATVDPLVNRTSYQL